MSNIILINIIFKNIIIKLIIMLRNIVKNQFVRNSLIQTNKKINTVILDWSGTTVDKYVIAPAEVFHKVFRNHMVPITMPEARLPMGLRKDLHIKAIMEIPEVKKRWFDIKGKYPTDSDVDVLFDDFVPMQLACLDKYSTLLPGVVETVDILRNDYKVKIGITTGFNKVMADVLLKNTKSQGFIPDVSVTGDIVDNGVRPKPFMLYKNLEMLDAFPIDTVVKVDDTVGGVGEGLNAGCWTVGLARYSNYMDIDCLEDEDKLTEKDIKYKLDKSTQILKDSGAHYVVDDITSLPSILKDINNKLQNGEKP
tara:strand:+ start:39 stop:965 length:927 start_codon:yes stop_codon:yes gene_type:complete